MTFKIQVKLFAQHQKQPISFKNYLLAKHHLNKCSVENPLQTALHRMDDSTEQHVPSYETTEESSNEPVIPVIIASMSTRPTAPQESPASSNLQDLASSSHKPETNKRLPCLHCTKTFTHRGDLNKHLRTHSGERPYPCPHPNCEKRFAHSSNLRRHIIVHSGDKPFDCDKCGRSFNRKDKLLLHQQTKLCRKRSKSQSASTSNP